MASEDEDIPGSGAVFTFGKSRFADNTANKFWIRNDKAVAISCGDDHSALVTENGRLYVFGANDWGQLGLGHTKSVNKPSSVKGLKHPGVVKVACGRVHTVALTRDRRLHAFGAGGEGQLGMGDSKQYETPRLMGALEEQEYLMISCGTDHSAALTATGILYTWGGGSEGQLGHGEVTEVDIPRELSVGVPVRMVSCGYYHSALLTEDKRLFTFGEGEGGKLGLGDGGPDGSFEPRHVSFFQEPVEYVSCGNAHTAAITEKGHIYTFGDGASGQLGLGPDLLQTSAPKRVARLEWTKCRWVSCGESHTAVITEKGSLYTFGDGRHGKLAQGEESFCNIFVPTKVHRFKGFLVEQVSCGGCHTLVRARKRHPPDDPASDSEPEEAEPRFSDPVLGAKLSKLANSVDLQGSLNGSLGGTARIRRRQREVSPLPPLSRTLPPLGSSTPKPSAKITPLSLKPLNGSTIPAFKLKSEDESNQRRGGGDEPDCGRPRKLNDDDSAMEDEEESSEEEEDEEEDGKQKKLPPGQDPLATTHFSKTGTREGMKPFTTTKKQPSSEKKDKPEVLAAAPLDRRKKPEKRDEAEEEENGDDSETEEEEEEEEKQPKKGKLTLSMMAGGAKTSSKKTAPARTVKKEDEESEEDDDDDEEEEEDEDDTDSKKKPAIKTVKPTEPVKQGTKTVIAAKKPEKTPESEDDEDEETDEKENVNGKKGNEKAPPKAKDAQKKDPKSKAGTSKPQAKPKDEEEEEDEDDDEDDDEDEDDKESKKEDKSKKPAEKTEGEEPEPKGWQFWKRKKKPESPSSSTVSPTGSTMSTSSAKKPGDQGGSKTCIIL